MGATSCTAEQCRRERRPYLRAIVAELHLHPLFVLGGWIWPLALAAFVLLGAVCAWKLAHARLRRRAAAATQGRVACAEGVLHGGVLEVSSPAGGSIDKVRLGGRIEVLV